MVTVVLVGIAVQDFVFSVEALPVTPEKHRARDLSVVGGGLSGNAAVAVARLGGRARLITRLGDDSVGRDILEDLEREGVDCSLSRRFPGHRSSLSAVIVTAEGERMVLNYADNAIPNAPDWLPQALPAGTDVVMGDTRWESGARHMFGLARQAGVPGILDADRAIADRSLLQLASHIAFSAQGLREMTGEETLEAGLAAAARETGSWLAVTDGARGTLHTAPGGGFMRTPAMSVKAVDTLGAGDVFHGALAVALGEGMAEPEAVRFASAAAAIKCTRFGGRAGAPTRREVNAMMETAQA